MRYLFLLMVPAASVLAVVSKSETAPVSATDRTKLVFSRHAALQGRVPSTPTVSAVFPFENRSDRPVTIERLDPSCGCLRVGVALGDESAPRRPPVAIPAGGSGRVVTTFETTQETPGPHEYTIDVRTDEPDALRPRPLAYRVTLPERKVTVQPVPLLFYQATDEELSQTVTVFDSREEPLTVIGADCPNENVVTEIRSLPDGRRTEILVRVVGELPRGTTTTFVTVSTDAADYEEIGVPIVLSGVRLGGAPDSLGDSDSSGASAPSGD